MAEHRHKRETNARRVPRAAFVAAPIAVMATLTTVSLGVVRSAPASELSVERSINAAALVDSDRLAEAASRSGARADAATAAKLQRQQAVAFDRRIAHEARLKAQAVTKSAVAQAKSKRVKLFATAPLNIWTSPDADAQSVGEIPEGKKILVTGRSVNGRDEVVIKGESRWVTSGYFSQDKPVSAAAGVSAAPCPDSGPESGLTANAVLVYRSVCRAFPQITTYGGWSNHGEHTSGRALDIMVSDVVLGTAIAEYLRAHATELRLYDVIWRQRIWTQERSGEGWRLMPSRGSATADHYDHVHVATY